jgi:hypothetical protein
MAGSLYTTVFDWKEGEYMPRKEVLELESIFKLVVVHL